MHPPADRSRSRAHDGLGAELPNTGLIEADLQDTMVAYTGGWASDTRSLPARMGEVLLSNLLRLFVMAGLSLVCVGLAIVLAR